MTDVFTVKGPRDVSLLGATLMHEHIFVVNEEIRANYTEWWDEEERVRDAVSKLRALNARGIDTIVDPTVLGLGRFLPRIQRIAEQIDLNIIVATGLYTYNEVPLSLQFRGPGTLLGGPEPLVRLFARDLTEGIAETGVRAAFLKCAVEEQGLTPGVERVLRAVIDVHLATGAPVMVHSSAQNQSGRLAQDLLRAEGVDLSRVLLAHCGDSTDLDYLMRLADAGSYLGMDRFGLDVVLPPEQRIDTVVALCARGYADRMVLGHDAACFIDWFPADVKEALTPRWNFEYIPDEVLPALAARGVTDAQLASMLRENPRRFFSGVAGGSAAADTGLAP
jgi:phosphotriesterase-related protein